MPIRIQDVLLVSSAYDAFVLEEDGGLTDRLFHEYAHLHLSFVPRLTHVTTAAKAMELLTKRRFDLVITVVQVQDMGVAEFSGELRAKHPTIPIVLLLFDESDLNHLPDGNVPPTIDSPFLWTGDARTLFAAIKLTEDRLNARHDTDKAGVQVILVVEDRIREYSTFLSMLYPALLSQAESLLEEGLNASHKVMRLRARPKVLLANSYDEGIAHFEDYQEYVIALISDVRFPRAGVARPDAGLALARYIRNEVPELPILMQSTEDHAREAATLGAAFLNKLSPAYADGLQRFLREGLGFGDFVFRVHDGTEIGRARNIFEMQQALQEIPAASVQFHATRNDFSTWLTARGMFALAQRIRDRNSEEFSGVEDVRRYLISVIAKARRQEQEGVITDFSLRHTGPQNRFIRLGGGSLGGKGRSVAFLSAQIVRHGLLHRFEDLEIRIPKTIVVGTATFDAFIEGVDLSELLELDDTSLVERFCDRDLPRAERQNLRAAFETLHGPVAVRSSSLLEDSRFQPFAGVYATYMLPNNHPDPDVRFAEVCMAIKAVYASVYCREARTYAAGTPHLLEGQKMAVLIQQVVGQAYEERFYPCISGVAQSYNYYPIGSQQADEGVATLALGLGETVVSGRRALRFSPGAPAVLPQYPTPDRMLRGSQAQFYALDLSKPQVDLRSGERASLTLHELQTAEEDGTLALVGSVYCPADDVIRENLRLAGPRVVTFNNILKWNAIPLAEALLDLLRTLRRAMGGEVEFEFALDATRRTSSAGDKVRPPRLYLLQVRPLASARRVGAEVNLERLPAGRVVCRTDRSLGHGRIQDIRDVVYVRRDDPTAATTPEIAKHVGELNTELVSSDRPYVLLGPGRWGTSDPSLGIPVDWSDICGARVIIEAPMGDRHVENSQGTHFFQNVTAHRLGYLTLALDAKFELDREMLDTLPATRETDHVRHVTVDPPLTVFLDGLGGRAAIIQTAEPSLDDDADPDL